MNFDEKAASWDDDPQKTKRAGAFANEINTYLSGRELRDAFEFGCGTGLLSFILRDSFTNITLADTSEGMLKVLKDKIRDYHLKHFNPLRIDLEKRELNQKFDIIYSLMALHHIKDLDIIFHRFSSILVEGGYLCIGDLEKEDGSFHSHMPDFDGHNGFEREKMEKLLKLHGFETRMYKDFFTIEKNTDEGKKAYPLFILIAERPAFTPGL